MKQRPLFLSLLLLHFLSILHAQQGLKGEYYTGKDFDKLVMTDRKSVV